MELAKGKEGVYDLARAQVREPFADVHEHLLVLLPINKFVHFLFVPIVHFQLGGHFLDDCGGYLRIGEFVLYDVEHQECLPRGLKRILHVI